MKRKFSTSSTAGDGSIVAVSALLLMVVTSGCGHSGGSSDPTPSTTGPHVVVIFQENRTPDNLFHGLPNADIASSGLNSSGQTIPLLPISLVTQFDLGHTHSSFTSMYDNGRMDGADKIPILCSLGASGCPPPNAQFAYVNPSEVASYFQLAQQYTFGDRMFQTNQGPSFPAHQFIISGTSAPAATSNLFAAENTNGGTGCAAPAAAWVWLIDPTGQESSKTYPCFEHATLTDLLDQAGLSWKYYSPLPGSIWTGPNAIQHICAPVNQQCAGPDWTNNVVLNNAQVLSDISNGQLAAVSWVIPTGQASDHASFNDGTGPSWVASVVNAIGNSPYWANTTIIITWDDWGGWYDHVAPPIINSYEYGFRVPLIVVSPYAKPGYVSHVVHDFGSILKFIEKTFNLPSLGYADAVADDLSDCFNFSQKPAAFRTIRASRGAQYFLNNQQVALDPDDD